MGVPGETLEPCDAAQMNVSLAGSETLVKSKLFHPALPFRDREGWSYVKWKHTPPITGFTVAARVFR